MGKFFCAFIVGKLAYKIFVILVELYASEGQKVYIKGPVEEYATYGKQLQIENLYI